MFKRTLIGGLLALLVMGLVFGRNAMHVATTSVGWVQSTIDENVPIELKIEQARGVIKQLEPEVRRNKHLIVREEVELEHLAERIDSLEAKQETEAAKLAKMHAEVSSGEDLLVFSGRSYTVDQVTRDMNHRLKRLKTNDETLENLKRQYATRKDRLQAARVEVEKMLAARNQLIADVEKLEARQKMTTVAQSTNEFDVDTSALARANKLIRDVETRLDVAERMLDIELDFNAQIPVDQPHTEDVSTQVAEYLQSRSAATPEVESVAAEITADPQL